MGRMWHIQTMKGYPTVKTGVELWKTPHVRALKPPTWVSKARHQHHTLWCMYQWTLSWQLQDFGIEPRIACKLLKYSPCRSMHLSTLIREICICSGQWVAETNNWPTCREQETAERSAVNGTSILKHYSTSKTHGQCKLNLMREKGGHKAGWVKEGLELRGVEREEECDQNSLYKVLKDLI